MSCPRCSSRRKHGGTSPRIRTTKRNEEGGEKEYISGAGHCSGRGYHRCDRDKDGNSGRGWQGKRDECVVSR